MGLPAAAPPPAVPRPEAVAPRYDPGCATLPSTGNGSVIVILRHGKTEHNKLGLFTGWEDAGLAREGRAEARRAGQLLSAHGFKIDVVYTSWLSRAIETAWIALSEMDALWIPIIKSWRLNERMYPRPRRNLPSPRRPLSAVAASADYPRRGRRRRRRDPPPRGRPPRKLHVTLAGTAR